MCLHVPPVLFGASCCSRVAASCLQKSVRIRRLVFASVDVMRDLFLSFGEGACVFIGGTWLQASGRHRCADLEIVDDTFILKLPAITCDVISLLRSV